MTILADRRVLDVPGAQALIDHAATFDSPATLADWFRDAAGGLDLAEAAAAARASAHAVLLAPPGDGPLLALRWFAPGTPTTIHSHGTWGVLVILEGHDTYERWTPTGLAATHYLAAGDVLWWTPPPGDLHRQTSPDGALELLFVGGVPDGVPVAEPSVRVDPLAEAYRRAYLDASTAPLADAFHEDVLLDVCVPGWRFQVQGRQEVLDLLAADEFGPPGYRLTYFRTVPTESGFVVEAEVRFASAGGERLWRVTHLVGVRDGRIAEQTSYCTGHWDAESVVRQRREAGMVRP